MDKFDAHCLDKRAYLFRLLRRLEATGSVFQLFRKPGAVGSSTQDALHSHATREGGVCVVECKIELTFVKLGGAYYGICWQSRRYRTKNGTNVRKIRRRVLRYVAVGIYNHAVRTTRLARSRLPMKYYARGVGKYLDLGGPTRTRT